VADIDGQLLAAATAHAEGDPATAERLYREIIERDPKAARAAKAWSQLGAVLYQQGAILESLACLERAVALDPGDAAQLSSLALVWRRLGNGPAALAAAEAALGLAPDDRHCLTNLACILEETGQTRRAALLLAGSAHRHAGEDRTALLLWSARLFLAAAVDDAALIAAHRALESAGPTAESLGLLLAAIAPRPDSRIEFALLSGLIRSPTPDPAASRPALAAVLAAQGRLLSRLGEEALYLSCLRRALALDPRDEHTRSQLAIGLHRQGRSKEALLLLRGDPSPDLQERVDREVNIGCILLECDRPEEARSCFESALAALPSSLAAVTNLARLHARQADHRRARDYYARARELSVSIPLRLEAAASPLIIALSQAEIDEWRHRFEEALSALERIDAVIDDPVREVGYTNFYLAYHGRENRRLHERWSALLVRLAPDLRWTSERLAHRTERRRLRIGFISAHFFQHSIGKTSIGLIEGMDRQRFEPIVLFVRRAAGDPIAERIARAAERWLDIPADLAMARELIAGLELDLLFYPDLGMDCFTWYLAHARLAPVQCTSFGHPDTTGIDSIDYFISSRLAEPADAHDQYSERLIELPETAIPTYYYPPPVAEARSARARLGLPEGRTLYLCAQAPFKLHPDMDPLFEGILEADPAALILLLEAPRARAGWTERLQARLRARLSRKLNGIRFLPRLPYRDYLALLGAADVALDTIHFNGMNTSLECFRAGTPVVCLRGPNQRSRHSAAMLARMELTELVADDCASYVETAVGLATDPAELARMRRLIRERSAVLFEDRHALEGFENACLSMHRLGAVRR
jgi:predicted O-linked N-acetylglucosamine transferase (SPINDLY family)